MSQTLPAPPIALEDRVISATRAVGLLRNLSPLYWLGQIAADIREIHRFRHVLRNLIVTQLKIRYHRSALGFIWTLLNPVLMLGVQAIVFSQLISMQHYAVYLFSGFIPWQLLASAVDTGSRSMLTGETLIRKMAAPKILFPLADVAVCLINTFFAMAALFLIFQLLGATIHPQLILILPGLILLTAFTFGLTLIAMSITTFFRDFLHIIPIFLTAWYFASPIMYNASDPSLQKSRSLHLIINYNPARYLLLPFQDAIYFGVWPTARIWAIMIGCAFVALAAGYVTYRKLEHEYIFRL